MFLIRLTLLAMYFNILFYYWMYCCRPRIQ